MSLNDRRISRRNFLKGAAASGVLLAAPPASASPRRPAPSTSCAAAPDRDDHHLINDSPWFPGFEALVEQYVKTTGSDVKLNVTPSPVCSKSRATPCRAARASSRASSASTSSGNMQFYAGGLVTPIHDINPDFELDSSVIEYDSATRWDEACAIPRQKARCMAYRSMATSSCSSIAETCSMRRAWPPPPPGMRSGHRPDLPQPAGDARLLAAHHRRQLGVQAYLHSYGTSAVSPTRPAAVGSRLAIRVRSKPSRPGCGWARNTARPTSTRWARPRTWH